MAIKCILENRRVDQILDVVKELRAAGLVQSKDFDFRWEPAHYDWSGEDRKSTRLNSSHSQQSRMPSSA